MDKETQDILSEQHRLETLVGSEGWSVARDKLVQKVLDLQNAFNINETSAELMLIDLKARKIATQVLYDWLRDVEGTAQSAESNKPKKKSYFI